MVDIEIMVVPKFRLMACNYIAIYTMNDMVTFLLSTGTRSSFNRFVPIRYVLTAILTSTKCFQNMRIFFSLQAVLKKSRRCVCVVMHNFREIFMEYSLLTVCKAYGVA